MIPQRLLDIITVSINHCKKVTERVCRTRKSLSLRSEKSEC